MMRIHTFLTLLALLAPAAAPLAGQVRPATHPGWLGFSIADRPFERAGTGVVVALVAKGSPADGAGLAAGDTILEVNGLNATSRLIGSLAYGLEAGDTVHLRLHHAGKARQLSIVAAPRPAAFRMARGPIVIDTDSVRRALRVYLDSARVMLDSVRMPRIRIERGDSGVYLFGPSGHLRIVPGDDTTMVVRIPRFRIETDSLRGLGRLGRDAIVLSPGPFTAFELGRRAVAGAELAELEPGLADYFHVKDGVLVIRVAPGTPAARAGLEAGDVVVRADGKPVRDIADLRRDLDSRQRSLALEVVRKGKSQKLELTWH